MRLIRLHIGSSFAICVSRFRIRRTHRDRNGPPDRLFALQDVPFSAASAGQAQLAAFSSDSFTAATAAATTRPMPQPAAVPAKGNPFATSFDPEPPHPSAVPSAHEEVPFSSSDLETESGTDDDDAEDELTTDSDPDNEEDGSAAVTSRHTSRSMSQTRVGGQNDRHTGRMASKEPARPSDRPRRQGRAVGTESGSRTSDQVDLRQRPGDAPSSHVHSNRQHQSQLQARHQHQHGSYATGYNAASDSVNSAASGHAAAPPSSTLSQVQEHHDALSSKFQQRPSRPLRSQSRESAEGEGNQPTPEGGADDPTTSVMPTARHGSASSAPFSAAANGRPHSRGTSAINGLGPIWGENSYRLH